MEKELIKISRIAEQYGISSRALRYYEEVGLIESIRSSSTQSRSYDTDTLGKLKQIITLKQIGLSINDIRSIFVSRDAAIRICSRKLQRIKEAEGILHNEKRLLQLLLSHLVDGHLSLEAGIEKLSQETSNTMPVVLEKMDNPFKKENSIMKKLSNEEVRLVKLNPMRVAYYCAVSESPEKEANDVLTKWVKDKGIDKMPHTRYFGYDASHPTQDNPSYGYEFCVSIENDVQPEAPIGVKTLAGGLYAVSCLYGYDIPVAWQRLMAWIEESPYEPEWPQRQCLEEHFHQNNGELAEEVFQLDLFEPIKKRIK